MSLPSQEILDDIKELITEITGFQEYNENFTICERYCLSHVVHHSYPFVNRTTVKNLVNSYVSRFYGQGYFKVSQELNHQIKSFLSNEKLFEKNQQYDIQWSLLSLVSSLSSNLTSVKKIPKLLLIDEDEKVEDEINWGDYLTKDLQKHSEITYSDSEDDEDNTNDENIEDNVAYVENSPKENTRPNSCQLIGKTEIMITDNSSYLNEVASKLRKQKLQEFINYRKAKCNTENDYWLRGNISEKFDKLMSREGIERKTQYISEYELMENVLYQFQTGERILLRKGLKNLALISLTQETLGNYLDSLKPYCEIIRSFKNFERDILEARYPGKFQEEKFHLSKVFFSMLMTGYNNGSGKIANVLYTYHMTLVKVLEPFQNAVMEIADNLDNYTLLTMEQKLQPFYFELISLYHVHSKATENWKKETNWMCAIRILSVLYNSIMEATTTKMSFLFLNMFLHCFQVYLDIIDNWIIFVDLIDPQDEFVVAKLDKKESSEHTFLEFKIQSYKAKLEESKIKDVPILDFIANKMIHVGQYLQVLKRLGRYVINDPEIKTERESSYQLLIKSINDKINSLGKIKLESPELKPQQKKKGIFTMGNVNLCLERDGGAGDYFRIENLLMEEEKKVEKKDKTSEIVDNEYEDGYYFNFIYSTIQNPYYKMAFENVGVEQLKKTLKETKSKESKIEIENKLMVVKEADERKYAVYPFHKIITESFHEIFGSRVSDACTLVRNIVLNECNLQTHLSLLRSVLLFNDAYLIQPFILGFFTQPLVRGSSYSLTFHLKECVELSYKAFASNLSVIVAKESMMECKNILEAIDSLTINYKVKWPLTLIFTPEIMEKYNKIFRVALKLKWAHWALSGLYFQSTEKKQSVALRTTFHRLQILRFRFLSALGRINNYFMAQLATPLDVELATCKDFKEIITVHSNFAEKIFYQCFLSNKLPEGRELIFETLVPLCRDLVQFWREGTVVPGHKLSLIEKIFSNTHNQLSRLMSSLEKV